MTDRGQTVVATMAGAMIGGMAAYMLFTASGRALRRQLEPAIEDVARELNSFRGTVIRAADVAAQGWKLLNDAVGESYSQARVVHPHQTSPF